MIKPSDKFNELSFKHRKILSLCECELQILQLEREKERLLKNYKKHKSEVDAHIKNIKKDLKKEGYEL